MFEWVKGKNAELLAPAGGKEQYISATENGANAIYVGGSLFNARAKAENFDLNAMEEAVDFGHLKGVKTYVTMNTLIKDVEMDKALAYAKDLYKIGVDALILQDMGLTYQIRNDLPDMEIHLSTQGSIYSLEGVQVAEKMGFSRVVLARELSLDEIREIAAGTNIELEVFVHGAYCICYSGQCQMSRSFGGRSGNRGACAQPCRHLYKGDSGDRGHLISPKDFNFLSQVGKLLDAGVASLKIEGRMKSPEYVAEVTRTYRKYLDEFTSNISHVRQHSHGYKSPEANRKKPTLKVTKEDDLRLKQIFNRGGFSTGFLLGTKEESSTKLISKDIPKHQGIYVGDVVSRKNGSSLVGVKVNGAVKILEMGDGIEIRGSEATTNQISYLKEIAKGLYRIGDFRGKISRGDKVYRLWSKMQMSELGKTFDSINMDSHRGEKHYAVDFQIKAFGGKLEAKAQVDVGIGEVFEDVQSLEIEQAQSKGLAEIDVIKIFSKVGESPFKIGNISVEMGEAFFAPKSKINSMRRSLIENLEKRLISSYKRELPKLEAKANQDALHVGSEERKTKLGDKVTTIYESYEEKASGRLELYFYTTEKALEFAKSNSQGILLKSWHGEITYLLPIAEIMEKPRLVKKLQGINWMGYISNVSKGKEKKIIINNLDKLVELCKDRALYIGNIEWLEILQDGDITLWGDYGLNLYNSSSRKVYKDLGLEYIAPSLEFATVSWGEYPLMTMEYDLGERELIDRKGENIKVIDRNFSDQKILVRKRNGENLERNLERVLADDPYVNAADRPRWEKELLKESYRRIYIG